MINLIGLCCLTYLITNASIFEKIKALVNISSFDEPTDKVRLFFQELLSCCMCTGFWVGIIFYKLLLPACIVSIAAEVMNNLIKKTF